MILAIDTATPTVSVALASSDGELIAGGRGTTPRSHAEELGPLLADVFAVPGQITNVVGGVGPGSFAGLRVGLAATASIGWALGIPATGLCTLDAVALASATGFSGYVVTDARRRELFFANYCDGVRVGELGVDGRQAVAERIAGATVIGDAHLLGDTNKRSIGSTVLSPAALGRAAAGAVNGGDSQSLRPLYLRAPDIAGQSAGAKPGVKVARDA